MKNIYIAAIIILLPLQSFAKDCKSELLRVEITNDGLKGTINSLLPALTGLSQSDRLTGLIERDYELDPIGFPHNKDTCRKKKTDRDPAFLNVDCEDRTICQSSLTRPEVRKQLCFALPCPILEGNLNPGKCSGVESIIPSTISFPSPVSVRKVRLKPVSMNQIKNDIGLCFKIESLEVAVGVALGLDTTGTAIPDKEIKIDNVLVELDSPKDVCLNTTLRLQDEVPVEKIVLTPVTIPFISEKMIRDASKNLKISGISGYSPNDLQRIQKELVPVLFHPLRGVVETAVGEALGIVFKEEINKIVKRSMTIDGKAFMSELGFSNFMVKKAVKQFECAAIQEAKQPLPAFCQNYVTVGMSGERFSFEPAINMMMMLPYAFRNQTVTSESLRQSLLNGKELVMQIPPYGLRADDPSEFREHVLESHRRAVQDDLNRYVNPYIEQISQNQTEHPMPQLVTLKNIVTSTGRKFSLAFEDACSATPSTHAKKKMPNCPVQVYADINDFNAILKAMWSSGRMCMQGRGKYIPDEQYGQQSYDPEGKPLSKGGCYFEIQGMSCYIKSAPQLRWDVASKNYKTKVELQQCFRGPAFLGLGRFGGDFVIDISFRPTACENGDFCVKDPVASWKVVPGTERYALRPSSMLNSFVTEALDKAIVGSLSHSIRIPLSAAGFLGNFPLISEGRTDVGPGYFGACLKPEDPLP